MWSPSIRANSSIKKTFSNTFKFDENIVTLPKVCSLTKLNNNETKEKPLEKKENNSKVERKELDENPFFFH